MRISKSTARIISLLLERIFQRRKERERYYIGLALSANGLPAEMAQELHKILYSIPKKELKSLNNAIIKKYGRDEGAKYYAVLKKHLKVIGKL